MLFSLPQAANCVLSQQELNSPLFGDKPDADDDQVNCTYDHKDAKTPKTPRYAIG